MELHRLVCSLIRVQISHSADRRILRGRAAYGVAGAIWSSKLQARGSIFRQPLYVADWLPTLSRAADIELDSSLKLDGIDLWPELSGSADAPTFLERFCTSWTTFGDFLLFKWDSGSM